MRAAGDSTLEFMKRIISRYYYILHVHISHATRVTIMQPMRVYVDHPHLNKQLDGRTTVHWVHNQQQHNKM
jgi:hypothetical protein